jgi:hypothetical protein
MSFLGAQRQKRKFHWFILSVVLVLYNMSFYSIWRPLEKSCGSQRENWKDQVSAPKWASVLISSEVSRT